MSLCVFLISICVILHNSDPPTKGVFDIGGGKSLWTGVYTSVRPAWKIFFNVDMANKPGAQFN